jgi:aldose 1-epimerase
MARPFGTLADGRVVHEAVIGKPGGLRATIIEWGAVIRDLVLPLPGGREQRVVLGLTRLEDYIARSPYFGAIAGRYANRIRNGRFTLDGKTHQLQLNQQGRHTLHGGAQGFGKRAWRFFEHGPEALMLALHSADGDQGFPGALSVTCRYAITGGTTLRMELTATCDAPTVVNLCQHSYFNLDNSPAVLDHLFQVEADFHTPTDAEDISTGEVRKVEGTPFDFRELRPIRHPEMAKGFFYDGNFPLRRQILEPSGRADTPDLARACLLRSPVNGLSMEIWTSEPGLQVYAGHKIDMGDVKGLDGKVYAPHAGLALEPQHFPNSPNLPHFPSTVLRPGAVYAQVTEFRFKAG